MHWAYIKLSLSTVLCTIVRLVFFKFVLYVPYWTDFLKEACVYLSWHVLTIEKQASWTQSDCDMHVVCVTCIYVRFNSCIRAWTHRSEACCWLARLAVARLRAVVCSAKLWLASALDIDISQSTLLCRTISPTSGIFRHNVFSLGFAIYCCFESSWLL